MTNNVWMNGRYHAPYVYPLSRALDMIWCKTAWSDTIPTSFIQYYLVAWQSYSLSTKWCSMISFHLTFSFSFYWWMIEMCVSSTNILKQSKKDKKKSWQMTFDLKIWRNMTFHNQCDSFSFFVCWFQSKNKKKKSNVASS